MSAKLFALHGQNVSLILEAPDREMPIWRHWGARLPSDLALSPWLDTAPIPSFSLDVNQPLRVLPLFGRGWMGPSALAAHRGGRHWAHAIDACEIEASPQTLTLRLSDRQAELELTLTLVLDAETDVLSMRTGLVNAGADTLDVSWLAAGALPLPETARWVESFSGRHNNEFAPVKDALTRSSWRRENRRGLTSHDCPPMASVVAGNASQSSGPVWSAQLAWSGNHVQSIDWLDDGRWLWMAGEWLAPGEVRLGSGDRLESPEWLATFTPHGRDGAARNFHAALRKRSPLARTGRGARRPVHLNTWEGVYFNHNEADLFGLATAAADLGVERFVLDDGWFKGRGDDTRALGDWTPDPIKYPKGLKPLASHVTDLGMEFGLWVEPEMVNPDSDLYRAHPEWALRLESETPLTARGQLVLDLSRPEVANHLFDALAALLADLPIAYLKWDHNRDLTEAANADGRPAYRRQTLAAYALIDRLSQAYPNVEIEACAGGGGRIDAGILARTHRIWTSDCIDAVSRLSIQRGYLQFFPPEVMGSHVGASPAHSTGRRQSMAFRAAVAMTGHFGVELDPRKLRHEERQKLGAWIAFYKAVREKLHAGEVWRGAAADGVSWQAHGDAASMLLFIYRVSPTAQRYPPSVRLPFVDSDATYRFARIGPASSPVGATGPADMKRLDAGQLELSGAWLREAGLPLPFMKAETCLVIQAERQ